MADTDIPITLTPRVIAELNRLGAVEQAIRQEREIIARTVIGMAPECQGSDQWSYRFEGTALIVSPPDPAP